MKTKLRSYLVTFLAYQSRVTPPIGHATPFPFYTYTEPTPTNATEIQPRPREGLRLKCVALFYWLPFLITRKFATKYVNYVSYSACYTVQKRNTMAPL